MSTLQRPVPPGERDRIARELGISPRTVKRAIDGGANVSRRTRDSVVSELERHGYGRVPEAIVGLVVPRLGNPFFAALAASIESQLAQQDMQLVLATSNHLERRENQHIRWMIGMRAAGVFYCHNPAFEESLHTLTTAPDLAVVLIDTEREGFDTVLSDAREGLELAVTHLAIENQHERIGFLAGPASSSTAQARRQAFDEAIEEHGLAETPPLILEGDYSFESGKSAALELAKRRRRGEQLPTAIISANDLMAIGLAKWLTELSPGTAGLRVPEDISVVGYDNIPTATMIAPELTSIDQRVDEIATRAVSLMVRRIGAIGRGQEPDPVVERVVPTFRPRQSVSRCPSLEVA